MSEMTLSNDELFAKANFEACQIEKDLGRKLTSTEYSEYVWWYMNMLRYDPELRPPNPFK
jgi:hypothetical protein